MTVVAIPDHLGLFTVDDWHAWRNANPDRRIELAEGSLMVIPTPPAGHAMVISRMFAWLIQHGQPAAQVLTMMGVVTGHANGRIPDLVLLYAPVADDHGDLTGAQIRLAVEVESRSTRLTDRHAKPGEYAAAGIAHFWRIENASDPKLTTTIICSALRKGAYHRYFYGPLDDLLAAPPVFHDDLG